MEQWRVPVKLAKRVAELVPPSYFYAEVARIPPTLVFTDLRLEGQNLSSEGTWRACNY